MKPPMIHQNRSPQGWQWLCSWTGLAGTPPVLLALLLAGLSSGAKAQVTGSGFVSISPTEIYEGERLLFTLTVSDTFYSNYDNYLTPIYPATGSTATEGESNDWYLSHANNSSRVDHMNPGNDHHIENTSTMIGFYVQANTDSQGSEGDETIVLEVVERDYNNFPNHTITITLKDGPRPSTSTDGVTLSESTLALTELGATSTMEKTYTMVLDTDPTADVTITVANGDATAVAVDTDSGTNGNQNTLTFTAGGDGSGSGAGNGNWATAQTVTVRALNDADGANESFNLTHAATTTGSTAPYHGITIDPVAITTADAGHGVVVSESSLSVADNDETATYTVVLKSQPSGNVEISTTSGATGTATASPATLSFSSSNWNTPKTVTVTGKGAGSTSISHAVATSADTTNYPTSTTIPAVAVTVTADTTAPRVSSIERRVPPTSPTNSDFVQWRVMFNEAVQNVSSADFQVSGTNATVTIQRIGDGYAIYGVSVSGGNLANLDGTVTLSFANGQDIEDSSGNALTNTTPTGTNDNTFEMDNTAPRVTSITRQAPSTSPTNADSLTWRVTFSEAVRNVLLQTDFQVSGTTNPLVTAHRVGSTNAYDVTASGGNLAGLTGTVTLSFTNSQNIEDSSGNALTNTTPTGTNDNTFEVDNTAPRVTSITRQTPSSSPTDADSLTWRVLFNEAVQNVNPADFQVSNTSAGLAVAQVGATNAYDVTASGGNLAGLTATVTLSFTNGQDIEDRSGNTLTNTTPTGTNHNTFVVNNTPTLPVITISGGAAVTEGTGASFTVNASTAPAANLDVTVAVTQSGDFVANSNRGSKTVTIAANATSKTYTVPTVNDMVDEGNGSVTVTVNSGQGYTVGSTAAATVTVNDDDQVTVKFSTTADSVDEGDELFWYGVSEGDSVTAGVTLSGIRSTATSVRIGMTAVTATGYEVDFDNDPVTITIPAGETSATGTIQTIEDNMAEDDETFRMDIVPPAGVTAGTPRTSYVSIKDDDTAAVNVSPTSVSVSEAPGTGRTHTYTVVLATRIPINQDVTINPTSSDSGAATVSPASLTFDEDSWNAPQTVTVTAVDDEVDQTGNRSVTISHSATSTNPHYNNISIANVTATVVDNDGAGVTINESDGVSVTEASGAGRTDTYTVVLATQPTHGVTITPTSSNTAAATVSPALTFTTSNWNTPQTVTVTGVDDNTDNPGGGREVSISHAASSTDPNYTTSSAGTVETTVTDDDATTVTLSGAGSNMEEGESRTFTITLGRGLVQGETLAAPLAFGGTATRGTDYTMTGTSATGVQYNNLNRGNARVVFNGPTSGTTATRATIALRATADSTAESPAETVDIGLGTITNTGLTNFGGVTQTDSLAPFTIADGTPADVNITESGGSTSVTEAAGPTNTDTYTVVLKSEPRATVTIAVTSDDPGAAMVSPATLSFTRSNWNSAQTVTVTGVDDDVDQTGNRSVIISHSATSIDANYNGNTISIPSVTATVVDDDNTRPFALPAVEFAAAAYSGGEASGSRTVNVALSATPTFTAATTVSYAVSGTATAGEDFTPLPGTVSMTGGAGAIPITILQDQMDDDGETIVLTLIAANGYTVGTQGSTTITITDDDGTTPPPSTLPVVSITGGGGVSEGEEASFTVTATPAPGTAISVNVRISDSSDFASSGQTGSRSITVDASGRASFTVTTEDDTIQEEDGRITATVQRGSGYTPHDTTASASVTVADDEVVRLSTPSLRVTAGGSASYQVALDDRPTGDVTVTIRVGGVNGEGGAAPSPNLSPPGTSPWDGANTMDGETSIRVHPATLTFTPANWDRQQPVTLTAPEEGDLIGTAITLTHTATGGGHVEVSTTMRLTVVAAHASEETKAWHLRLGRTLAHQVVTALEERWSAPPATGLQLTVAGETVPSATAVAEHEGLLTKALGFETVTPQALLEGSSFSLAPEPEGAAPRLAFWGQGAFSSFSGEQEDLSLDGDVTTLLLGADWHTEHWQAGAALSQSWGSGSYDGENGADGEITSTMTGLFPYGRYALTPRLGLWAITGYGWGELSLKPDGPGDDATPNTTLGMAAVGLDGVLRDGGSEGITLTTTADVLTLKTTSAEVDGLDSSEGSLSRRRVGLEAVRPFPLSNGASLLPSMALGIRHDSGDAEAGYGLDLGAGLLWQAPQQGISGELKGHTLLTHTEESLQEQGLALSFSWQPHPSNHGPSLSLSHAMGAIAAGDMDTLLHPTTMEGLDAEPGNGQRLTAELAYGFPAHNDHITLTPAVALALSPTSRNYSLLWSVAPYAEQLQGKPWELSLTGQRQEQNTATAPVEHSLKLTFSTLF